MSNDLLSLLLDIVILILLGATIFYVSRLTRGLEDFKKHREEFDSVIANLLASIDQADHSVRMLKKVSAEEANRLEQSVKQATALSEELSIISETGESMAKRLEKLAETNRKLVQPSQSSLFTKKKRSESYSAANAREEDTDKISSPVHRDKDNIKKSRSYDSTLKHVKKGDKDSKSDLPSFMVRDKDYEDMDGLGNRLDSSVSNDGSENKEAGEDVIVPKRLQSQAEKDLFDALRSTRKKISGTE